MKKCLILIGLVIVSYSINGQTVKQDVKKGAKSVAHGTKQAAKTVGNKTAEVASKTAAKIADEKIKDKEGPDGQDIYVNSHSKYYWIDKKGHKNYVQASQLKNK
jgi:uncharacterized protein (UPF0333 family)